METEDETEDERGKVNKGSGWSKRWHGAHKNARAEWEAEHAGRGSDGVRRIGACRRREIRSS